MVGSRRVWRLLAPAVVAMVGCGDSASPTMDEVDAAAVQPDGEPRPERPDGGDPFVYFCTADLVALTDDCDAPVTGDVDAATATFAPVIDMAAATELVLTARICDPTGFVLVITDSPTGDGNGGDAGTSSNDAEIEIADGTNLAAYSNDLHPSGPATILVTAGDYVSATGCTTLTWVLRDQVFRSTIGGIDQTSPHLLRIDPPTDAEGTPDALWHLGVNRTFGNPTRTGTGVTAIDIGLR